MPLSDHITESVRDIVAQIHSAPDPQMRLQACRGAVALGQDALSKVDGLSARQITEVQDALRLAQRESEGVYQTHLHVARLARAGMQAAGLQEFPIEMASRAKTVPSENGVLTLGPVRLRPTDALGQEAVVTMGGGGRYSVVIRVLEGDSFFLAPRECPREVDRTQEFALNVTEETLYFGAAEDLSRGTRIDLDSGRYSARIFCIKGGRGVRLIATLLRTHRDVAPLRGPVALINNTR